MSARQYPLYNPRGPYKPLSKVGAPQRLVVLNADIDNKGAYNRDLKNKKSRIKRKYGGDSNVASDIQPRDICMEYLEHPKSKRVRMKSSRTPRTTLKVVAAADGTGTPGMNHIEMRRHWRWGGLAKTKGGKNIKGQNDRIMVPILKGGMVTVTNRFYEPIPVNTPLIWDFSASMSENQKRKQKVGPLLQEDPNRAEFFFRPINPLDHRPSLELMKETVGMESLKEAKTIRNKRKNEDSGKYEMTQFADSLMVVSAFMGLIMNPELDIMANTPKQVAENLKTFIDTTTEGKDNAQQRAFTQFQKTIRIAYSMLVKGDASKLTKGYHAAMAGLVSFLDQMQQENVTGDPFNVTNPDLSGARASQITRYYQTKMDPLQRLISSIRVIAHNWQSDIVAMSTSGAAPGDNMNIMLLK